MIIKSILRITRRGFYKSFVRKMSSSSKFELHNIIAKLENFAPLKYAEIWDNVGLLIEPYTATHVHKIFLTNDLTEGVFSEAVTNEVNLIISYHPPIFSPLKRITQNTWKERLVAACLEKRIALYSPHTAWDAVKNGVGDWLATCLPHISSEPILKNPTNESVGCGRLLTLSPNYTLNELLESIKAHTGNKEVHLAFGQNSTLDRNIKTAAICPGSGASVFKNVEADLYLTGEMSHHEILDATQRDIDVVLLNHSNSERGYLKIFKEIITPEIDSSIEIIISTVDRDPLMTL